MTFRPKRVILTTKNTRDELAEILLYGLIVSHGIRVDTEIRILKDKYVYVVRGIELRHLYPQKKSLLGFVDKIVLREKIVPGTHIEPLSKTLKEVLCADLYIIRSSSIRPRTIYYSISLPKLVYDKIVIIDEDVLEEINDLEWVTSPCIYIKTGNSTWFIVQSHYLIDISHGGWIRRRGKIEYYNRVV
ncbi:MAG: hypothetical protein ABWW65_00290 [Thermoprotei archaeon]